MPRVELKKHLANEKIAQEHYNTTTQWAAKEALHAAKEAIHHAVCAAKEALQQQKAKEGRDENERNGSVTAKKPNNPKKRKRAEFRAEEEDVDDETRRSKAARRSRSMPSDRPVPTNVVAVAAMQVDG
jgi:hypothetical protein